MKEFLSIEEVAALLRVNVAAVNKWIKTNKIKYEIKGNSHLIPSNQFKLIPKYYVKKSRKLLGEGNIELVNESDIR